MDAAASLRRILHDARRLADLDLVLVSGDISDDGSPAGYRAVRDAVGRFAADRGIPHVYTTGNHDDRDAFTRELGTGHLDATGADAGAGWDGGPERVAVSSTGGLRVITLDSLIPGSGHGENSGPQLHWLSGVLTEPSPARSVLVFHHPPVHVPASRFITDYALKNADELAKVIVGSDVQAILCGHFHVHLAGVPVWVTPGVVTRIDLTAPAHLVRAVKGASASVIDLGGPFSPAFHVIHARDPEAGEQVYLADPATLGWEPVDGEDA